LEALQGKDAGDKTQNRTEGGVVGAAMPNGFVADAIFLPRKREGDERGVLEIGDRARKQVEGTGANPEYDVA
jgi:hypothetical protein